MNIFISYISKIGANACEQTIHTNGLCQKSEITIVQTNESALKCLSEMLDGKIDRIISLVSNKADEEPVTNEIVREKAAATGLEYYTAYGYFKEECCRGINAEHIKIPTEYADDEDVRERATADVLSDICGCIGKDDAVYIDTTGGPRNALNLIQLLTKILECKNIKNPCSFYTNIQSMDKRIDTTDEYKRLMKLADGVNEFVTAGKSSQLRECFDSSAFPEINALLKTMTEFTDKIQLCNTDDLDETLTNLYNAINGVRTAESSNIEGVILKNLLPVIEEKFFGDNGGKADYVRIIEWCLDNGLIQQALTIFVEKVPVYLYNNGVFSFDERIEEICAKKNSFLDSREISVNAFYHLLMNKCSADYIAEDFGAAITGKDSERWNVCNENAIRRYLSFERAFENINSRFKPANVPKTLNTLSRSYNGDVRFVANILKNTTNKEGETVFTTADTVSLRNQIRNNKNVLYQLTNQRSVSEENVFTRKLTAAKEFESADKCFACGFSISVTPKQLAEIMYGYIYAKALRNQCNHAGKDENLTAKQKRILQSHGYITDNFSVADVTANLRRALDAVKVK